jgi:hypothetical protein
MTNQSQSITHLLHKQPPLKGVSKGHKEINNDVGF